VILLRALLLVPLDYTELGLILGILHYMPVKCLTSAISKLETETHLLILSVDTSSFNQFRLELLDSVLQVSRLSRLIGVKILQAWTGGEPQ
jgi:hypothetical protein